MYIDLDCLQCLQCGNCVRPSLTQQEIGPFARLSSDGTFHDTAVWFCSVECYQKAVGKFLDPRFYFDKWAEDDEEYSAIQGKFIKESFDVMKRGMFLAAFSPKAWIAWPKRAKPHLEAFTKRWNHAKQISITQAEDKLLERVRAELDYQHEQAQQKLENEMIKMQERELKEQLRLDEKRQREAAAAAREAERQQKELQRRAEREEERRTREEERKKREEYIEKRDAERAEEKRQREEEKRRKEEEEQAAKEAEEEKWTPREFGNI